MKRSKFNLLRALSVGCVSLVTLSACTNWTGLVRWVPGWANEKGNIEVTRKDVGRFVKSTRQATGNSKTHYLLASYYVERSRFGEAIEEFKKAILIDRTHVKAYNGLGVCYDRLGFHKDAQQYYRTALQVNPKLNYLQNNLGYSYILEGAYGDAVDVLERAVAHGFEDAAIYNNLALAYARTDQYELALEAFLSVGDKAAAHHNMAVEYEEAGLNEKAREHYEIAKAIESGREVIEEPKGTDAAVAADAGITAPVEVLAQPVMDKNSEMPTIVETDLAKPESPESPESIEENEQPRQVDAVASPNIVIYPGDAAESFPEPTEVPTVTKRDVGEVAAQEKPLSDLGGNDNEAVALIVPVASLQAEPADQEALPSNIIKADVIQSGDNKPVPIEPAPPVVLEVAVPQDQQVQSDAEEKPAAVTAETVEAIASGHKVEETLVMINDHPLITNKAVIATETVAPAKISLVASLEAIVPMGEQLTGPAVSGAVQDNLEGTVSIQVSNGCGVRNIAHTVQDYLRQRGFHVVIADDADHHDYSKTMVYYIDPHLHNAFDVAQQIPLWQDMDEVAALRKKDVAIRILLGKDMGRFMQHFKEGVSQ